MKVDYIGCPAGGHRIRKFQSDICLKKHDGSEMRFYHNRCAQESQRIIATKEKTTGSLTRRRVL
jgi:hypothetical protein